MSKWPDDLEDFQDLQVIRMRKGAAEYGDDSFTKKSLSALLTEIQEELIDTANWAFIMWQKTQQLREVVDEVEDTIRNLNDQMQAVPDMSDLFVKPGVGNRVGGGEPQRSIQHEYYGFDDTKVVATCHNCNGDILANESFLQDDHLDFCQFNCMYEHYGYPTDPEE